MIVNDINEGDLLQCDNCGRRIRATATWLTDVQSACKKSTNLRHLLTPEWPSGTAPLTLLSKLKCKICENSGVNIVPRSEETTEDRRDDKKHNTLPYKDLYKITSDEFKALALKNFSGLSPTQVITIYNQTGNITASPEHLHLLQAAYAAARAELKPRGGYAFVEYSNTDGQ